MTKAAQRMWQEKYIRNTRYKYLDARKQFKNATSATAWAFSVIKCAIALEGYNLQCKKN